MKSQIRLYKIRGWRRTRRERAAENLRVFRTSARCQRPRNFIHCIMERSLLRSLRFGAESYCYYGAWDFSGGVFRGPSCISMRGWSKTPIRKTSPNRFRRTTINNDHYRMWLTVFRILREVALFLLLDI
jgi:hypothetical protein